MVRVSGRRMEGPAIRKEEMERQILGANEQLNRSTPISGQVSVTASVFVESRVELTRDSEDYFTEECR